MERSRAEEDDADMETWPQQLKRAAILSGAAGVRRMLEDNNASINTTTNSKLTALHLVLSLDDAEMEALGMNNHDQSRGQDTDQSPLVMAERALAAVVKVLLDFGANVRTLTPEGREPLFLAVKRGMTSIVKILLGHGAKPDHFSSDDPPTALHLACGMGQPEMVQELLEGGAEVNIRDVEGATPLFRAIASDNLEVARMLLQRGASTRVSTVDGKSAFDLAQGNSNMINLLKADRIIQGPRIKGFEHQYTPRKQAKIPVPVPAPAKSRDRVVACKGFDVQIVDFYTDWDYLEMIEKSASVYDVVYEQGPTAIMEAARKSQMSDRNPNFTWYHLPANNMVWAEVCMMLIASQGKDYVQPDDRLMYHSTLSDVSSQNAVSRPTILVLEKNSNSASLVLAGEIPTCNQSNDHTVVQFPYVHIKTQIGMND